MNYIFNSPGGPNFELPAGCERAPVFEHAPSSPISFCSVCPLLKGLAQAKIIKKSVILSRVLNMTI